jgi:hypothetical protein
VLKHGDVSSESKILSVGTGRFEVGMEENNKVDFLINTNRYITTNGVLALNQWSHIICIYDGSNTLVEIYVDGVLEYQNTSATSEVFVSGDEILIGERAAAGGPTGDFYFEGGIGPIRMWDSILTAKERAKLYKEFLDASPITRQVKDNLDYPALKPHDLSHLVDSRIGNPDAPQVNIAPGGGTFDDATGWTVGSSGWSISGGIATCDGTAGNNFLLDNPDTLTTGKTYFVQYDVVEYNSGSINVRLGTAAAVGAQRTSTGTFYDVVTADGDGFRMAGISFNGAIDNLFIFEWTGEELIPDADVGFVANDVSKWTAYGTNIVEQDGSAVKMTYVDSVGGAYMYMRNSVGTVFADLVQGGKYTIVYKAKMNTGSGTVRLHDGTIQNDISIVTDTSFVVLSYTFTKGASEPYLSSYDLAAGEIMWIEVLSVMKVTGLVAAYNMIPSPEGVLVDISGNGYNGTIVGATSNKDGLEFDGNDHIELSDGGALVPLGDATWNFRINTSIPAANNARLLSNSVTGNGYEFFLNTSSTLELRIYTAVSNEEQGISGNLDLNKLYTVSVVKTGNIYTVYLNGVNDKVSTYSVPILATSENIHIGSTPVPNNWSQMNSLNDLQFYNYAFSEQQAEDYHNQFAEQVKQRHGFDDLGVGSTIG